MRGFRKVLFWVHLVSGVSAGVIIFVMCVTGALLSFERNLIEFSERELRYTEPPADVERLSPQQIINGLKAARPDAKPSAMSTTSEPGAAWMFNLGRDGQVYVDPYTGEILGEGNKTVRGVMSELRNWHRYVALSGDGRPVGKAITGIANLMFLLLAMTGIYIWFPRKLEWRRARPMIWFRRGIRGRARNFNWHTTIGFWTSLLLIIFTLTATVISFQWASNLLYTLTGNEVPRPSAAPRAPGEPPYEFPTGLDPLWMTAENQAPGWRSASLRLPIENNAAVFTIDEGIYLNIFGRSTLTVDADSGTVAKWEPYGEQNGARQLRTWFRFTHTGETGGIVGQIIGFIACVGGAFLVWTGFSLALRRARNWAARRSKTAAGSAV